MYRRQVVENDLGDAVEARAQQGHGIDGAAVERRFDQLLLFALHTACSRVDPAHAASGPSQATRRRGR